MQSNDDLATAAGESNSLDLLDLVNSLKNVYAEIDGVVEQLITVK